MGIPEQRYIDDFILKRIMHTKKGFREFLRCYLFIEKELKTIFIIEKMHFILYEYSENQVLQQKVDELQAQSEHVTNQKSTYLNLK